MKTTTLSVDEETRERLKKFGTKGEDYDKILNRMMDILGEMNLNNYIEAKYKKLMEDKHKFISLEEYEKKDSIPG
ncbi:MAG: hypothetical protein B6U97_03315 [Candidatus Altiarchaeales archaeon ex4484_96]|nr:MAG: hypothetical protein B6U97_03315 [Candidatus Altiarchaeales archaeon ex4484_96]